MLTVGVRTGADGLCEPEDNFAKHSSTPFLNYPALFSSCSFSFYHAPSLFVPPVCISPWFLRSTFSQPSCFRFFVGARKSMISVVQRENTSRRISLHLNRTRIYFIPSSYDAVATHFADSRSASCDPVYYYRTIKGERKRWTRSVTREAGLIFFSIGNRIVGARYQSLSYFPVEKFSRL